MFGLLSYWLKISIYSHLSESISHFSQSCFQCLYKTTMFDEFVLLFNILGRKEAIPGRIIPEMLQFGLEPAEKLPAILHRKMFYYIIRILFEQKIFYLCWKYFIPGWIMSHPFFSRSHFNFKENVENFKGKFL